MWTTQTVLGSDRRRMGACRASDPASKARRRQTNGRHARCRERRDVYSFHRLPMAGSSQRPAAAQHRAWLSRPLELGWNARSHPPRLYVKCREKAGRDASPTAAIIDSQSVKSAEKGGAASTLAATTRARKSKARSATSLSIRKAC